MEKYRPTPPEAVKQIKEETPQIRQDNRIVFDARKAVIHRARQEANKVSQ